MRKAIHITRKSLAPKYIADNLSSQLRSLHCKKSRGLQFELTFFWCFSYPFTKNWSEHCSTFIVIKNLLVFWSLYQWTDMVIFTVIMVIFDQKNQQIKISIYLPRETSKTSFIATNNPPLCTLIFHRHSTPCKCCQNFQH